MPSKNIDFWSLRANRNCSDAPGVPSADDLLLFSKYAEYLRSAQDSSGKSGLVLGCTLQIINWCRSNSLRTTVMDFSKSMVDVARSLHCDWEGLQIMIDDWLSTMQKEDSFCWAAGDGVVNVVGSGQKAILLFQQIRRLMLPGSLVIVRHFIRPDPTPSTEEIFAKLASGGIHSFSAFRHQMCQSMQSSFMDGIPTCKVRNAILQSEMFNGDPTNRFSWSSEQLMSLDLYAFEGVSRSYPTLAELHAITRTDFEVLDISYGNYEMAELCPTIVYQARAK